MTEPTLLQQARAQMKLALRSPPSPIGKVVHGLAAVSLILQHLEQREAAIARYLPPREPAQVPSEREVNTLIRDASAHVVNVQVKTDAGAWAPPGECDGSRCVTCGEDGSHINHAPYFNRNSHAFVRAAPPDNSARAALDLDALQRLCDAATPGPWCMVDEDTEIVDAEEGRTICELADVHDAEHDGAFIAAARDALPKLIAEVRRLRHAATAPVCVLCGESRKGTHCADCGGKLWQDSDGDYHSEEPDHG